MCLYIRTILNFSCVTKHKITYNIKWYFRLFTINWRFSRSPKNYSHFKRKVNRLYRRWFWLFSFDEKYRQYIVLLINAFVKLKRDTLKNACAITTVVVVLFKKCTWFKSLATLLTSCKQWILLSNLKIHVTKHPKENQKLAMQQNNTGPYDVLSLIKCLIFYQGMNHLVKVAGDIGRIHPIVCVPVGGNPDLVKVFIIYSPKLLCMSFWDDF